MKYLKLSCIFLLLLLSFQMVTFAEENADEELLVHLGVVDSGFAQRESISRAEFAYIVVKFMNIEPVVARKIYADVAENHPYAAEITLLSDMGYINGDGSGNYNPDAAIETAHAAKILVCALGYHPVCRINNSFLAQAQNLGLFKGVPVGSTFDGKACAKMLSNALKAPVLKTKTVGETMTFNNSDSGEALVEYFHLNQIDGVVTAVNGASLTGARNSSGQMVIGGYTYPIGSENYDGLLGYRVKAYVDEDEGEIVYCETYRNNVVEILVDDINESKTTLKTVYTVDNQKYNISGSADYLYNGNGYFEITAADMLPETGSITLIDNDNDGTYDVVSVYHYDVCAVNLVNYNTRTLTDFYGNTIPSLEECKRIEVFRDGTQVNFNDISQSQIALVAVDKTGQFAKILVSDKKVSGLVEAIGEKTVDLGGTEYEIAPGLLKNAEAMEKLSAGNKVDLRLDPFGKVAYIRSSLQETMRYGYLIKISSDGAFLSNFDMKVLLDDGQIDIFKTASKVKLNGKTMTEETAKSAFFEFGEFVPQIIKYQTDENGNIKTIYTVASDKLSMDFGFAQRAQSGTRVFGVDGDFIYNSNTVIFSVPKFTEDAVDEDYSVASQVAGVYKSSEIAAYDVTDFNTAAAVVRRNETTQNSGTINNDDKNYNPLMVVDKVTKGINEKRGEPEYYLYCHSRDGALRYFVSSENYHLVENLKKGDAIIIKYNEATEYVLDVYLEVANAVDTKTYTHKDEQVSGTDGLRWFEWIYGKVDSRYGDMIKISDKDAPSKPSDYRIYAAGAAKVIIVGSEEIRYGSLADVTPDSEIVLRSRGTSVMEVIIYE
ncbi:MAG: S-layer homology domain-containing protein [Clostridia bacterium]|nr:S-layer homology domain-containing protein [Clostridia bacterium]